MSKYISPREVEILKTGVKHNSCKNNIDTIANNLNGISDLQKAEKYYQKVINELINKGYLKKDKLGQYLAGEKFSDSFELNICKEIGGICSIGNTIEYIRDIIVSVKNIIDKKKIIEYEKSLDFSLNDDSE